MTIGGARVGPVLLRWTDAASSDDHPAITAAEDGLAAVGAQQVRRHASLEGLRARRFALGRHLLATLIGELAGPEAEPEIDTTCALCGADHGAPRAVVAPVALSVSYAGSVVVAAAAPRAVIARLGVDVERRAGAAGEVQSGLAALFAPAAPPDLAGWTRIEAVLKADGRGVRIEPADVVGDARDAASARLPGGTWMRVPGVHDAFEVATVGGADAPEGCVVSLAVAWA
ncbi:hypothetical protein ACFM35_10530 [Microbacterium sp. P01]|uniref:hypothetical protein n=1 Tax=Microbacterium sp. P01 TaxID=3366261 RepID=UPI00366C607B